MRLQNQLFAEDTVGTDAQCHRWRRGDFACPSEDRKRVGNQAGQGAGGTDAEFQAEFRKTFIASLPATLTVLRAALQSLVKSDAEVARLEHIHELYGRIHTINSNASIAGLIPIAHMAAALEALLKELYEKPKNINASTLRTVAAAVDFLGFLFECGARPEK